MGEQLTVLLVQCRRRTAQDPVFSAAYRELRRLAHSRLHAGGYNTVPDTTALVHEPYLRFVQTCELKIEDRQAFFCYASQVIRSVIVDRVGARMAERRGGDLQRMTLSTDLEQDLGQDEEGILQVENRYRIWRRPMRGRRRWCRCAISVAIATRKSPKRQASPSERCSATERRQRYCSGRF